MRLRVFFVIFLLAWIFCVTLCATDAEQDRYATVIDEIVDFEPSENGIYRIDFVATIMKILGVDGTYAKQRAEAIYDPPKLYDVCATDGINAGYVFIARGHNIVLGVDLPGPYAITNHFAPYRNITIKEALAIMLRCLLGLDAVPFDMVVEESLRIGLLREEELSTFQENESLQYEQFRVLLYRMLDQYRGLYWPTVWPSENSPLGYGKMIVRDDTKTIKYIDWYLESIPYYEKYYVEEWKELFPLDVIVTNSIVRIETGLSSTTDFPISVAYSYNNGNLYVTLYADPSSALVQDLVIEIDGDFSALRNIFFGGEDIFTISPWLIWSAWGEGSV